jgi:hypothetical protein
MKSALTFIFLVSGASALFGQSQYVNSFIIGQDSAKTYLGRCSTNNYEYDSIINSYGQYGSTYSLTQRSAFLL